MGSQAADMTCLGLVKIPKSELGRMVNEPWAEGIINVCKQNTQVQRVGAQQIVSNYCEIKKKGILNCN